MLNCEEASRLMSEARERPLSRREQWSLRFHKAICRDCRQFDRQIGYLRRYSRRFSQRKGPSNHRE